VSEPALLPRRVALGLVLPAACFIATLLPFWLFGARLPEPLASGWNLSGQPTGSTSIVVMALLIAVFSAILAFNLFKLAFRPNAARGEVSHPMGVTTFAAGALAALSWITTRANLDATTWKQADLSVLSAVPLSILVIAALGAIVGRAGRALEAEPGPAANSPPSAGLPMHVRAFWVGTARATGVVSLAVIILIMALMSLSASHGIGIFHVVIGLNLLLCTAIRVTVDRSGVRIAYGLLGWPVQRLRLAQIRQASTVQVKRIPWGGWIYQGSLNLLRRATVGVRDGQGIRLELEGERTLDIAIDDAEQAAGVINDLVAANRGLLR
jgi:hypothetical protein